MARAIHLQDAGAQKTGARLPIQLNETLAASDCSLALAGAAPGSRIETYTRESSLRPRRANRLIFELEH